MPRKPAMPIASPRAVAMMPVDEGGNVVKGAGGYPLASGDDLPPVEEYEDTPPENSSDRVMALLGDVADDERAIVKVYRKHPDGKNGFCDEYSPAEFEAGGVKMIRKKWGVGDFVIFLYGITPRGNFGVRTKAELRIDPVSEPERGADNSGIADVMRAMSEQNALILKALTEKANPGESLRETLSLMTTMREAMGLGGEKKSELADTLALMRELRSASEELNPPRDDGGDGGLMGMASKLIPLIGKLSPQPAPSPAPAPMPALPPIDPPGSIVSLNREPMPAIPAEGEPMSAEMLIAMKLRAYIATLMVYAKSGVDAQRGADLIYERIPDEWIELLSLDTWWTLFVDQVPQAGPYQEWFTKARDLAMAKFQDDADAPEEGSAAAPPKAPD